jgi:hypothetical protein
MTGFSKNIARFLIVSMFGLGLPVPTARAEMITTMQAATLQPGKTTFARERLKTLFDRADVRAELERRGVSATEARKRIDALSDDEVERLAGRLDSLPAGGDLEGILWIAFLAFLVLLVTDILGFTKVFSFTRPAK